MPEPAMKLDIDDNLEGYNKIDSYSADEIVIAGSAYTRSLIVSPLMLIDSWPPQSIGELSVDHLAPLLEIRPEVLLIGSGESISHPSASVMKSLEAAETGYEIMDTGAACRSYNFLVGEGRHVAAALFVIGS